MMQPDSAAEADEVSISRRRREALKMIVNLRGLLR
jgi:hypothetical protein